jgi:hypothetical protein
LRRICAICALTAIAALSTAGPATSAAVPQLYGSVGPHNSISLKNRSGKRITTLKPGLYHLTVRDRSRTLNFHMRGKGVNLFTPVKQTGSFGWSLRLPKGTYVFYSDRARKLKGSFRVT